MIIALNAIDETEKQGIEINIHKLARTLGLQVVEHISPINKGT
jgi:Fe2+ transport system protein B